MKTLIKSAFLACAIFVVLGVLLIFSILQSKPTTVQDYQISASSAKQSQQLLKRLVRTAKSNSSVNIFIVNQQELHGLAALLHRAIPQANADINLSKYGVSAELSVVLPLPTFIRYLNIYAHISPSKEGLNIEEVAIGNISISGSTFLAVATWLSDMFVKEELAEKTLSMVHSIDINKQRMVARIKFDNDLLTSKPEHSLLTQLRDDLALFGDVETIAFYHQSLSDFAKQQHHRLSIAVFVRYMFDLARTRSQISDEFNAVTENQAAIAALVTYFGDDKFELLVGDILNREYEQSVIRNRMRRSVTLQGRNDLQKHFIYSMAIQLFSTENASDALGEFKEFLDTNAGGSGFSFADLQADRAGTRLALIVTRSEYHAEQSQSLLANITDELLLPSIDGLHEGLNEDSFDEKYKNIQSKDYESALVDIDNRLKTLPIYNLGWE